HHLDIDWFSGACSVVLILLLINALVKRYTSNKSENHEHNITNEMENNQTTTIIVKGMTCGHCKAMVEKNLSKLAGVESVTVDLASGETKINGTPDMNQVKETIDDLGFSVA
ncbi:MAG: cation transporter, partial [Muribaculaceae bacterium]|nr:cation transporter [Muribaculaceae bacterium]